MQFGTFGPFRIPLDEYDNVQNSLTEFWDSVDLEWPSLSGGRGCYVFGIATSGGARIEPWYVGKTNRQGFDPECFSPHQRNHYSRALNYYDRARPYLYIIPQFANNGERLYRGKAGAAIDFLETYLIGLALRANKELLNQRDTKLYREVSLPGFLNSDPGNPGTGANRLRQSLRF